nr:serpin family protein [Oriental turtle dovepox virus]
MQNFDRNSSVSSDLDLDLIKRRLIFFQWIVFIRPGPNP